VPDAITPVAAQIRPPDPSQGINSLSGVLGLKQQQQALQTGQYQQATAQAESQQAQQKNNELQKVGALMQSVHGGGYRQTDGSLDRQKLADDISIAAPVYGQPQAASLLSQANEIVSNQKAKQDLTDSARSSLGTVLTSLAKDPNTKRGDVVDAYTSWMQDHKNDPAAFRVGLAQAALLPQNDADPKFRDTLGKFAATLTGQPTTAPSSVDTGTQVIPGQTSGITGAFTPAQGNLPRTPQGGITKQIPPQLVTPPGGIPVAYPGGKGPVQGTFPGVQPTSQDIENFGAYQQNLNSRVGLASDSIPRIKQAEAALDQIRGGAGAEGYAKLGRVLQAAGLPQSMVDAVSGGNLAAAQEAEKYLFQTTLTGLKQSLGGGSPYAGEANKAEALFPSIGTDPRASRAVLNFMEQQGQRDYAEQQALNKARKEGTFNPATWQGDYQAQLRAGKVPGVPQSQVPTSAKSMPGGVRLKAYADKYTGGDLSKAQEALRAHGYQ
jgi:hypothetical protein